MTGEQLAALSPEEVVDLSSGPDNDEDESDSFRYGPPPDLDELLEGTGPIE